MWLCRMHVMKNGAKQACGCAAHMQSTGWRPAAVQAADCPLAAHVSFCTRAQLVVHMIMYDTSTLASLPSKPCSNLLMDGCMHATAATVCSVSPASDSIQQLMQLQTLPVNRHIQ